MALSHSLELGWGEVIIGNDKIEVFKCNILNDLLGGRYYWIGLEDFETYGTWIWNHTGVKADFVM